MRYTRKSRAWRSAPTLDPMTRDQRHNYTWRQIRETLEQAEANKEIAEIFVSGLVIIILTIATAGAFATFTGGAEGLKELFF